MNICEILYGYSNIESIKKGVLGWNLSIDNCASSRFTAVFTRHAVSHNEFVWLKEPALFIKSDKLLPSIDNRYFNHLAGDLKHSNNCLWQVIAISGKHLNMFNWSWIQLSNHDNAFVQK